jgi:thioredoxin-like negative regulator of GroEL
MVEQSEGTDALLGLGELCLAQGRWAEMEEVLAKLEQNPKTTVLGLVLRAQGLLAFQDFDGARADLATAIALAPKALSPRLVLSRVFWQEGRDRAAPAQALRDVLTIDPNHAGARANLAHLS